jgi:MFS family permease
VVCAVQFLDAMDIASMGSALPKIQAELHMSPSELQWVVSGYVLGFGGFVLLGGRLADLLRRRRLLITWLVIFAAASLLGGLADSGGLLVGTRVLKGVSAAFTAPAALAILLDTYRDGERRNSALGVYLMTASVGFLLGLVVGGALATVTWRLTLFLPAGLACLIAVLARMVIPADQPRAAGRARPDVAGAVTVTAGLLALVFGVTRAAASGWLARSRSARSSRARSCSPPSSWLLGDANRGSYLAASPAGKAAFDPVFTVLQGIELAQLFVGALGVITVTGEYSSGLGGNAAARPGAGDEGAGSCFAVPSRCPPRS